MTTILVIASWLAGSCILAELLGYWLHRVLHSGMIGFLSRNHMRQFDRRIRRNYLQSKTSPW